MNPSNIPPVTGTTDEDLIEQSHPGQGVPSQDPSSPAQFALKPNEAERETNSVLMGGGLVGGAAAGAAIGAAVAGPLGILVGGSIGAVVGTGGAAAAGSLVGQEGADEDGSGYSATLPMHSTSHSGGSEPTPQLDDLGKDFGVFYPRGHMVVAFQNDIDLQNMAQGVKSADPAAGTPLQVTSTQMIEFAERNIPEAGVIATMGTSVTTLQRFLDAAKNNAVFLIVPTPDDEAAEKVTTVLHRVPHLLAERYRDLAIETIV